MYLNIITQWLLHIFKIASMPNDSQHLLTLEMPLGVHVVQQQMLRCSDEYTEWGIMSLCSRDGWKKMLAQQHFWLHITKHGVIIIYHCRQNQTPSLITARRSQCGWREHPADDSLSLHTLNPQIRREGVFFLEIGRLTAIFHDDSSSYDQPSLSFSCRLFLMTSHPSVAVTFMKFQREEKCFS